MIQRIQTIYLFLSAVLIFLIFMFPLSEFLLNNDLLYILRYRGIYEIKEGVELSVIRSLPLATLFGIILFVNLINIFLFKNRGLQMRICVFSIILMLGSLGLTYYYVYTAFNEFGTIVNYKLTITFPLIAAILNYMAFRGIRKDEKLVKSLDRIR